MNVNLNKKAFLNKQLCLVTSIHYMKEADAANMTQQECQYIQGVWPQQHKMAMNWEKSQGNGKKCTFDQENI